MLLQLPGLLLLQLEPTLHLTEVRHPSLVVLLLAQSVGIPGVPLVHMLSADVLQNLVGLGQQSHSLLFLLWLVLGVRAIDDLV